MKLFANSQSPFVRKVRITLYEKGAEFDSMEIRYGGQRPELLQVNARGEVPALQDAETVGVESSLICDYIEQKYPSPPLLPSSPSERAQCKGLERVADTHTDVLQFFLSLMTVRRPELRQRYPTAEHGIGQAIGRHYQFLESRLSGGDYFMPSFSRADIAFVPHITGLVHLGHPIPDDCPHLSAWLGRMLSRSSVQRDAQLAIEAFQGTLTDPDGFFRAERIHWRSERVEWAVRFGLGSWLLEEMEAGRAYFPDAP